MAMIEINGRNTEKLEILKLLAESVKANSEAIKSIVDKVDNSNTYTTITNCSFQTNKSDDFMLEVHNTELGKTNTDSNITINDRDFNDDMEDEFNDED